MPIHFPIEPRTHCCEHSLACPKCKPDYACDPPYLHLQRVSRKAESVSLLYECEICGEESWLHLEQCKGQTLIYWAK
jgi:hypothetical protein